MIPRKIKKIWAIFWMKYSGVSTFGKIATRLANLSTAPYLRRRQLAALNSNGYISANATICHENFITSRKVFIDDHVLVFQTNSGGDVILDKGVNIFRYTLIQTGENGRIEIGESTAIQSHCNISAYVSSIKIGKHVQIAPKCSFYSYNHGFSKEDLIYNQPLKSNGEIVIGDDAWLGVGVTVLDNVKIGQGAVIGAGSVVASDIPDYSIAVGSPAKVIGVRS